MTSPLTTQAEPVSPYVPNTLRRIVWVTLAFALLTFPFMAAFAMIRWYSPSQALWLLVGVSVPVSLFSALLVVGGGRQGVGGRQKLWSLGASLFVSVTLSATVGLIWREGSMHKWVIEKLVARGEVEDVKPIFESDHRMALKEACVAVSSSSSVTMQQMLLDVMQKSPGVASTCLSLKLPKWDGAGRGSTQRSRLEVVLQRWWNELYEKEGSSAKQRASAIASLDKISSHPHTMLLTCSLTHPDVSVRQHCNEALQSRVGSSRELAGHVMDKPEYMVKTPGMRRAMVSASFLGRNFSGQPLKQEGFDEAFWMASPLRVVALNLSCESLGEKGVGQEAQLAVGRAMGRMCKLNLPKKKVRASLIWREVCDAPRLENKLEEVLCPLVQVESSKQMVMDAAQMARRLVYVKSQEKSSAAFARGVAKSNSMLVRKGYDMKSLLETGELYNPATEALRQEQQKIHKAQTHVDDFIKDVKAHKPRPKDKISKAEEDDLLNEFGVTR